MLRSRRRRRHEEGQSLVLVLVFFAFFSLIAASIVGLARAVDSQRSSAENTAASDSVVEGSAQLALGTTSGQSCGQITGGTMTFPGTVRADTLTFSLPSGSTGCNTSTTGGLAPGSLCELCLLNGPSPNPSTVALNTGSHGLINMTGELDSNGSISGNPGSVTASKIGIYRYGSGGTCSPGTCAPTPTALYGGFFDPLSYLAAPSSSTMQTCSCSGVINPGVYNGMNIGNSKVLLNSGVYIVTGGIQIAGNSGALESNNDASTSSETDSDANGVTDQDAGGVTDSRGTVRSDSSGSVLSDSDSGNTVNYSTTTLTDTAKNWGNGQWVGAQVVVKTNGNNTTSATVASSSAHSMTISGAWSNGKPANGKQYNVSTLYYTNTTLTDTQKNWTPGQWAGAQVTVNGSTVATIASNTTQTITINGSWTAPAAGSPYSLTTLYYTNTTLTDTQKSWTPGQWANAQVTVNGSTVATIAGNTSSTITINGSWTAPAAGSPYSLATLFYGQNTLTDSQKSWTNDQWAGAKITVKLSGSTITTTVKGNTAHTITITPPSWGTQPPTGSRYSLATLFYTATTLTDSQKNWTTNQWANAQVTVTLSNNSTETATVASNDAHTLTLTSNWGATTPADGNAYSIVGLYYTSTTLVDVSKNWSPNEWANSIVSVTLSNSSVVQATVASNTATTLTLTSPWSTTPSTGNQYALTAQTVIYFGCSNGGAPYWSCGSGQSGGYLSASGQGRINITPYQSGPYQGIAIFADRNLSDPGGGCVICVSGQGGSLGGTVYVPQGTVEISGGGANGIGLSVNGRLIARDLVITGNSNAQMQFTGPGITSAATTCTYFDADLSGTRGDRTGSPQPGHVTFETGCGSGGLNGQGQMTGATIISFAYGP